MDLAFETDAGLAADVERADALRTVDLVAGKAHQVNAETVNVEIHLAGGLRGVAVEEDLVFVADLADRFEVLNDADFIVDGHHGNEDRVRTDSGAQGVHVNETVFLHIEVGHFEAFAFEMTHGVKNRLVFGLHRDEVLALFAIEVRSALDGKVVAFRRTRRPDDFAGIGADQSSHMTAGLFNGLFRFPTEGMAVGGRIAELFVKVRNHLFDYAGIARGRGRVVEINGELHHCSFLNESSQQAMSSRG